MSGKDWLRDMKTYLHQMAEKLARNTDNDVTPGLWQSMFKNAQDKQVDRYWERRERFSHSNLGGI